MRYEQTRLCRSAIAVSPMMASAPGLAARPGRFRPNVSTSAESRSAFKDLTSTSADGLRSPGLDLAEIRITTGPLGQPTHPRPRRLRVMRIKLPMSWAALLTTVARSVLRHDLPPRERWFS